MSDAPDPVIQTSNSRQLAAIVAVLSIAAVGLYFNEGQNSKSVQAPNTGANLLPDTIVEKPLLDAFDAAGQKVRQLRGEQIQFFDADKRSIITSPDVYFGQKSNSDNTTTHWRATANTATVYQSDNKIELQGNALLWSDAPDGQRTEIATEQISIDTVKQFAETNNAVKIRARNSEAQASGMHADLANKRLTLLSRVKEIHEIRR